MHGLTKRQEQTLDFIRNSIGQRGYPPTLREIGAEMGIRSTNGVNDHLRALERKGYVKRADLKSRALTLTDTAQPPPAPGVVSEEDFVTVQVVSRITNAGTVLDAENVIDIVRIDRLMMRSGGKSVIGLRVAGDAMAGAGLLSGDYAFVRRQAVAERGAVALALVGDEAMIRYFYPERDYVRFQAASESVPPVLVRTSDFRSTMILGVVVGSWRRF